MYLQHRQFYSFSHTQTHTSEHQDTVDWGSVSQTCLWCRHTSEKSKSMKSYWLLLPKHENDDGDHLLCIMTPVRVTPGGHIVYSFTHFYLGHNSGVSPMKINVCHWLGKWQGMKLHHQSAKQQSSNVYSSVYQVQMEVALWNLAFHKASLLALITVRTK